MRFLRTFVFSLFFLSQLSFADPRSCGNVELPDVDYFYPLLEVRTFGGYVPSELRGWEQGVQVTGVGTVFAYSRKNRDSQRVYKQLGTISLELEKAIKEKLEKMPARSSVVFPDKPYCMDAPSTVYKGKNERFKDKTFAEHSQCLTGYLKDFGSARILKDLMDGYMVQAALVNFGR